MFEALKHNPVTNAILRRPPGLYGASRRLLARVEAMNHAELQEWQDARIAQSLSAARRLPGYAQAPASERLEDWPILTKAQILGREADFATPARLPRIAAATGGTTGQPMQLARTWRSVAFEQALIDHLCACRGVNAAKARIAILRGDSIKPAHDMQPPYWIDEGPARRIFSAHHLSEATACRYKAALRSFEPDILFCYPSSLANLLALIGEGESIRIPLVFSSSEVLADETCRRAQEMFQADVIDFYGHAERIVCAWSVNGGGYRFVPAYGHVELIPHSEGLARIVATSARPGGQIFVRYETGDLARVPTHDRDELQDIALGLRSFAGIDGRASEFVEIAGGRRIIGLNHIPRGVSGAASIQLFARSQDVVEIYIAATREWSAQSMSTLAYNFRQKFPPGIEMRAIGVERPVREKNGKAPLLLRAPDPARIHSAPLSHHHTSEKVA